MSEFYLSPSVKAQAIPGKGNGFVCCGPEGVREGTLLLRERVFEAWAPGTYAAASIAARLLFRCRQDASNVALLSQLFPATIDMISKARRDQIPAAAVESALRLVAAWEAEADAEAPGTSAERVLPLSRDSLLRFYFVVECNSFPTGLLVTLSFANHSCNPNCAVFEQDPDPCDAEKKPIYTLTAKRDICIGEEITISYIDLVSMVELSEDRQRRLEEHFLFHCSCEWCNSPLDRVGLLKDVPEDSPLLKGPLFEDFSCSAFPQNDKGDCENGMVGRLSGVCSTCSRQVTQKMLDKVQEKADRLMVGLRRTLLETNEFLKKMDDAKRERESLVVSSRPSTSDSHTTTTTEGDERIKDTASLKELIRLKKLMDGFKTRAQEILHGSHLAFGPIDACLNKLEGLIGFNTTANQKSKGKNRSKEANKSSTICHIETEGILNMNISDV